MTKENPSFLEQLDELFKTSMQIDTNNAQMITDLEWLQECLAQRTTNKDYRSNSTITGYQWVSDIQIENLTARLSKNLKRAHNHRFKNEAKEAKEVLRKIRGSNQ